jgi:hypothetical protein
MAGVGLGGLIFWLVVLCGASYFYLKIKKKEITFLKVIGLGVLLYLALILIVLILFII